MHKKSLLIVILSIFLLSFVIAQNASTNQSISQTNPNSNVADKAYQCLQSQIDSKSQNTLSLQESVFSVLALGSNSKALSVIDGKIIGGNHWQESTNPLKDTSQVLLAYDRIGRNTDTIKSWLLSNKRPATDLTWYLEIDVDNHESSQCTLSYASEQRTISINQDMTLSGNPGSCLSVAASGFWLRINNNCIDNNFTVSCDKDFTTSTLYQRTGSSTVFVSPSAHSTSALGTTTESVSSKCFSTTANACDYEGTLWAALAMDSIDQRISDYLPYLLALSESNQRFLPSSFLHILTQGQDQYSQLVQSQKESKYWQAPNTPYNRYYDSALALLSLQGANSIEETNSKAYFESITTPEGCWNNNNIRDTAFLLYSGWQRFISAPSTPGSSGSAENCDDAGYSCNSLFACGDLGGSPLENYLCPGTKVCCSESPVIESCLAQNGNLCSSTESCSGTTVQSSDGSCCLGDCSDLPQADECTAAGAGCYDSCNENEEQLSSVCSESGKVCCKTLGSSESGGSGAWITILIILIILIALAIIFRNKIKMALFKSRNKPGTSSQAPTSIQGRPPFPPFRGPIPYPRAQPRIINPSSSQPMRRPMPSKDKEMEETMAKLKEMSK